MSQAPASVSREGELLVTSNLLNAPLSRLIIDQLPPDDDGRLPPLQFYSGLILVILKAFPPPAPPARDLQSTGSSRFLEAPVVRLCRLSPC